MGSMRSLTRGRPYLVIFCLLCLAALPRHFATAQGVASAAAATSTQILRPGDQVSWQVVGQSDMNKTTIISDGGDVIVPLAGLVHVSGLSTSNAAHAIESALKAGQYLVNPHVSLFLLKSRVSVIGEVEKQGVYHLDPDATVLDLLADAGGPTPKSSGKITILRKNAAGEVHSFAVDLQGLDHPGNDLSAAEMHLAGGDQVVVQRAGTFYVNGQVNRPGVYSLEPRMTVLEAIAAAGGPTDKGSESRVEIQRTPPDGRSYETLQVKLTDRVLTGDVIVVKERIF
jgi:polysaccharide export outer membrane protein